MAVVVNYWAVLIAAIAAFAVGMLWHGPLFGKVWMRLMNIKASDVKKMKLSPQAAMGMGFVSLLLVAFIVSYFVDYLMITTAAGALFWTLLFWLGFQVPIMFGNFLWENRPFQLFAFNAAYRFVELFVIVLIVALWA